MEIQNREKVFGVGFQQQPWSTISGLEGKQERVPYYTLQI